MDEQTRERQLRLMAVLKPYTMAKYQNIMQSNKRMVHYTSAENLVNIIKSKQLWLRSTTCMADYREVEHGYGLIFQFFQEQNCNRRFVAALNACYPGIAQETLQLFDDWWKTLRFNTYIASISEHENEEDTHGRLSMWRAFRRGTARAVVVMNLPRLGDAEGLRVLLSPVAYLEYPGVENELNAMLDNIVNAIPLLQTMPRDEFKLTMMFVLASLAVSIKHTGFTEEKEWRVIYFPHANPSPLISSSIEVVDGVPQTIYQIPLEENPESDVVGVGLSALVDRIIVGPTVYPFAVYQAYFQLLKDAGVSNPERKVILSQIPIRS
jgi:hypothetical protein